ncbi:MAG TPA: Yip1 family protein [Burkholderiaceae bacterium]|jgi:hypothetical protein
MKPIAYSKMLVSFHDGWDEVQTIHPSIAKTFWLIIMPFSLLPPAMLLYAGMDHPTAYMSDALFSQWQDVAVLFLFAELISVSLMAWAIKQMALARNIAADFKDTFLLAAITAIPMWLSSLGLVVPNLWFTMTIAALGLVASASLLYHGIFAILKLEDEMDAQALSYATFSVGIFVWVVLCTFVIVPLMN